MGLLEEADSRILAESSSEQPTGLEATPSFFVALVVFVIVAVSLLIERGIHFIGHRLEHAKAKELLHAFDKLKEEMLLLGFISLLVVLLEEFVLNVCINSSSIYQDWAPCEFADQDNGTAEEPPSGVHHIEALCPEGQVPFITQEALHQIHLLVWMLAVVHILYACITMVLASIRVRQWAPWEAESQDSGGRPFKSGEPVRPRVSFVSRYHEAEGSRVPLLGRRVWDWVVCLFRQFWVAVRQSDYIVLRSAFIHKHGLRPDFNFHSYLVRCLQDDFSMVIGIHWSAWLLILLYILVDLPEAHVVLWYPFLGIVLIVTLGAKQQRIIQALARDADASEDDPAAIGSQLRPRDTLFWFNNPHLVLYVIYFVLFVNALQVSLFFFHLWQGGIQSCYLNVRVYTGIMALVSLALICFIAYQTLPAYSIVSQMGDHFKGAIFSQHVRIALKHWAKREEHGHEHEEGRSADEVGHGESSGEKGGGHDFSSQGGEIR